MEDDTGSQGTGHPERRCNGRLRDLFGNAYGMIEPFFDPAAGWGGRSREYVALGVLRNNFPQISPEEARTLVIAAHRVYIDHHPDGSSHLPRPDEMKGSA